MATYTIIGSDQKPYGSVTADQLRQWLAEGRINGQTKVQPEGSAEWKTISEFPELVAPAKISPPPLPPGEKRKTSALAVTSLVLGILGFFSCGVLALFGLIFGIVALVKIKNNQEKLGGFGLALAGTIISGCFLLLLPLLAAMMLPALAAAKNKAQAITCVNNEKQLALAVKMYSASHTNQFPAAATWCDAISAAVGSERVFKCHAADGNSRCDYAFNAKLDGLDAGQAAPNTVMIFEADGGWDAHGGSELMINRPRHARVFVVTFVDGSVRQMRENQLGTLRWEP
jgi:hypothetical protein